MSTIFRPYTPTSQRSDRSARDRLRHRQKIKDSIRDNIGDILAEESIIGRDRDKVIKIPIRSIKEYRFIYGDNTPGVAQGNGDQQPGDVVQSSPEQGQGQGEGGNQPGVDAFETEITLDELIDIMFEDLELPELERKSLKQIISTDATKRKGRRHAGIRPRLDKRITARNRVRRKLAVGRAREVDFEEEERRFPFHKDDMRYFHIVPTEREESNAVVFCIMDTSGSMGTVKKYLARSFYFLLYQFVRQKYNNVEVVFIAHHTEAKEVTEEEFFHKVESGGTYISSGYRKALEIINDRYHPSLWNIYAFHCSDGDNFYSDNDRAVAAARELCEVSNLFGYGEIKPAGSAYYSGSMLETLGQVTSDNFCMVTIERKEDLWPAFRAVLTKDRTRTIGSTETARPQEHRDVCGWTAIRAIMTDYDLDELKRWDDTILELVDRFGLNCYPQEFEICDHNDMIGYMAYSGMPSHYPHWSYGKGFERQKTMYEYGVSGLPYEMVINSNPCIAYLMRDNTLLLQILTIAHVYGHNDFFANNFTFKSGIDARYTIEMFKNHANRVKSYIEDPSINIDLVEGTIDHAHAISWNCQRNMAIRKMSHEEQIARRIRESHGQEDPWSDIHPPKKFEAPDLAKFPLEPEEDILLFIADNNPFLPDWKRDVLRIVDQEARYFLPQMETKIMNEGWASYWHHKILNTLGLEQGLHLEFLVRHNQVLRPHPGSINPYHLGFILWHDIERRWNEGNTGREYTDDRPTVDISSMEENDTPGRKKIFEIRETDRDASFLRRFLTVDVMRELELFQHEKRGKDRVITKVSDDEGWEEVKENLIRNTGMGSIPVIKIDDADFGRNRTLYLKHFHDGRDLQLEYAEQTLRHIRSLWEREVVLETSLNGKRSLLKMTDGTMKVEKL